MSCLQPRSVSKFPKKERRDGAFRICIPCLRIGKKLVVKRNKHEQKTKPEKRAFANALRQHMTPAEAHLWELLRKLTPLFLPQAPIYGYVADFLCERFRVLIEVDGPYHDLNRVSDAERDENLARKGYRTLRFTNERILAQRATVVAEILEEM